MTLEQQADELDADGHAPVIAYEILDAAFSWRYRALEAERRLAKAEFRDWSER